MKSAKVTVVDGFGKEHVFNDAKYQIEQGILHIDSVDGMEGASFAHWSHVIMVIPRSADPIDSPPPVEDARQRRDYRQPRHVDAVVAFIQERNPKNRNVAIAEAYGISIATASRWIAEAKAQGRL